MRVYPVKICALCPLVASLKKMKNYGLRIYYIYNPCIFNIKHILLKLKFFMS